MELTKHDNVNTLLVLSTESEHSCPVSNQCALVASKATGVVRDKDVPTLNVTKLMERKTVSVQEHHGLSNSMSVCVCVCVCV